MREWGLKSHVGKQHFHHLQSLPVRECGLKWEYIRGSVRAAAVTPRAGVWIEIFYGVRYLFLPVVTPRAGVWIEIGCQIYRTQAPLVTPRAGVWIEISIWRSLYPM